MTTLNKTGLKLNELLEKNYDAEKGYLEAAKRVNDPNLQRFFKTYAEQRYRFGHDIKGLLKVSNQFISKGGSAVGALHRAWLDTKSFFSTSTDEAIIQECIRGEEYAIEEYKEALEQAEDMAPSVKIMIEKQLNSIKEARISLQELGLTYATL